MIKIKYLKQILLYNKGEMVFDEFETYYFFRATLVLMMISSLLVSASFIALMGLFLYGSHIDMWIRIIVYVDICLSIVLVASLSKMKVDKSDGIIITAKGGWTKSSLLSFWMMTFLVGDFMAVNWIGDWILYDVPKSGRLFIASAILFVASFFTTWHSLLKSIPSFDKRHLLLLDLLYVGFGAIALVMKLTIGDFKGMSFWIFKGDHVLEFFLLHFISTRIWKTALEFQMEMKVKMKNNEKFQNPRIRILAFEKT